MKKIKLLALLCCLSNVSFAQSSLIDSLIQNNYTQLQPVNTTKSFTGKGWDLLVKEMRNANAVLIGETHFTNEVPFFTSAVIDSVKFDNYFHEIDPYTNKIIESKIKKLSPDQMRDFLENYKSNFSFLSVGADFKAYEKLVRKGVNTFGVEQVSAFSDRLIVSELLKVTKNKQAKEIYTQMLQKANELMLKDKTMYIFTDDCLEKTNALLALPITAAERTQLEALKLSRGIYLERNHHLRIQLLKSILLNELPNWENKKNLFKFGAVHTPKGESLLKIFDIGNLVFNVEDGNFRSSLHVMIVGKGEKEDEEDTKLYASFLKVVQGDNWYCFDLRPLQKSIAAGKLTIESQELLRIIKGNDYFIYVPKFTKSEKF